MRRKLNNSQLNPTSRLDVSSSKGDISKSVLSDIRKRSITSIDSYNDQSSNNKFLLQKHLDKINRKYDKLVEKYT